MPDEHIERRVNDRRLEDRVQDLETNVGNLKHWAFGNGQKGAAEALRVLKGRTDEFQEALENMNRIEKERSQREHKIEGGIRAVVILLGAFGTLSAGYAWWLQTFLEAALGNK